MRLNTIDNDYIMIPVTELTTVAYNSTKPRDVKYKAVDMIQCAHNYSDWECTIDVIGIKKNQKLLDRILDEYVSLEKFGNALMYTVFHDADETIIASLQKLLSERAHIKLKDLESISPELADFIIKNGDYNYISDTNLNNQQDKDFILYDEDEVIRIRLNERGYNPKLQNPDVK